MAMTEDMLESHENTNSISLRVLLDDDDVESYFDLNMDALSSHDFNFQVALTPIHSPLIPTTTAAAEELFHEGLIVPLRPHDTSAAPSTSRGTPDLANRFGFGSISTRSHDEASGSAHARVLGKSSRSRWTLARNRAGALKFLFKFPSEKIRLAFLSIARTSRSKPTDDPIIHPKPHHTRRRSDDLHTKTARKRPIYRALLVPLRGLFAAKTRAHDAGPDVGKPRMVDIRNDHSNFIKAVVEAMNGNRKKGQHSYWNRPNSAPSSLQASPRHWSASIVEERMKAKNAEDRGSSISSAIAYCKGEDHDS